MSAAAASSTQDATGPDREQLECRICMAADTKENLVEPCGCKGGSRYVHYTCIQTWILTDKQLTGMLAVKQPREPVCEVCGEAWRGDFKLPPPAGRKRTPAEEELEVVKKAIVSAWLRVQSNIPRPRDEELLCRVAPLVKGPWSEYVNDLVEERNKRQKWDRRKASVKNFFSGGKSATRP